MAAPTPRAPIAWLLTPLLIGYIAASALPTMPVALAALGALFSAAAWATSLSGRAWAVSVWPPLALAAGVLLAGGYIQHRTQPPPGWDDLPPREATLTLKIDRLFSSSVAGGRVHGFATISESEAHLADLVGQKIYFTTTPSETTDLWEPGTGLPAIGILRSISQDEPEEDTFTQYLVGAGAFFEYRRVNPIDDPTPARGFLAFCASQNKRFESYLRRGSIESLNTQNVYVAMLLGKRAELSEEQKNSFLQTGTLHLFAISGLHIGVVAFALHSLLTLLRVPQKPAAVIGLILLFCFVGITGAAPSAIRAFLMVLFFWGARLFVRAPNPIAALANSALFVLLLLPNQLWNPGFQLSYTVVAGILFLGLPLARHLQERWTPFSGLPPSSLNWTQRRTVEAVHGTAMTLAVSLSATLLSSPLSIHYFGIFAPGAVLLNLLLIPAAGLVIVAGFISVFLSLCGLGIGGILFNHAGWILIAIMEFIVGLAQSIPFLFWEAEFLSNWQGPLAVLAILSTLLVCAYRQWQAPFFHFVTPFFVFILFLATTARLTFLAD